MDSTGLALADDAVPTLLLRAIAEYSVRAHSSVLLPDPTRGASGSSGVVQRLKEKVGPIETDTTYAVAEGGAVQATIPEYPDADLLLQTLLWPVSFSGRAMRL